MTSPVAPSPLTGGALSQASLVSEVAVGLACLMLLMATSPVLPLVWDEPNAIERADQLSIWLKLWIHREPGQPRPWESGAIHQFCPYTTVIEGHPDFYGLVIAFGRQVSSNWLPPRESYRFGPMLLFSIAASCLFHRLRREHGLFVAAIGVVSLFTMPRLFAHAHFASIDGPLTACWIMTWATFDWARRSNIGCLAWGVLLGLTMSCKFTGWLSIAPFLIWSLVYRDRDNWRVCVIGGLIALITFVDVNPALWDDPVSGLQQFFSLNLHRADHGLNIPIQFFETRYDMHHPLPWYNSAVWLVITVPVVTVLLAGLGCIKAIFCWRRDAQTILLVMQVAILTVVKALPLTPPHDAERLFLPSFAFLAPLAGIGGAGILDSGRTANWSAWIPKTMLLLALIPAALETTWYTPQWLSYYSPVIGGLKGAARAGMEPTYYWDGLDHDVIAWLESQSGGTARVYLYVSPEYTRAMNRFSVSKLRFSSVRPEDCGWCIIQNRPGLWTATDRELMTSQPPLFVKTIRNPTSGFGPWRLNVPVVAVYSREQWSRTGGSALMSTHDRK